jgi:hypothetical protein
MRWESLNGPGEGEGAEGGGAEGGSGRGRSVKGRVSGGCDQARYHGLLSLILVQESGLYKKVLPLATVYGLGVKVLTPLR